MQSQRLRSLRQARPRGRGGRPAGCPTFIIRWHAWCACSTALLCVSLIAACMAPRALAMLQALWVTMLALPTAAKRRARNDLAALGFNVDGTTNKIIGAVLAIAIVGGFMTTYFDNLTTIVGGLANGTFTTGSTTVDALLPVFALLLGILAVMGLVRLIARAVS